VTITDFKVIITLDDDNGVFYKIALMSVVIENNLDREEQDFL
jgi:hypothetical protein